MSKLKISIISFALTIFLFANISIYSVNVSPKIHPNLAQAQKLIEIAISKISDAQKANEANMNEHADKAKELLQQAYDEIKLTALSANENMKSKGKKDTSSDIKKDTSSDVK